MGCAMGFPEFAHSRVQSKSQKVNEGFSFVFYKVFDSVGACFACIAHKYMQYVTNYGQR